MGMKTTEIAQIIVEMLSLPLTAEEFQNEIAKIYREIFPSANLMPGNK